ncbi:hypothetical protein EMCG_05932 [[Emmonsia] crescens]|uniref:Uncharacterized protein n=1 Tax=[Emmonsia] crescens TaxID=73230 RepID=A0A0G2ID26_9EURO|nr:hypothetical protein EMCG_05932 [Emmonsia crescens UAMH 3008]
MEWKVPYGSYIEVPEEDVINALGAGEWPQLSSDNPAEAIIRSLWSYSYESSERVVADLQRLLLHTRNYFLCNMEVACLITWSPDMKRDVAIQGRGFFAERRS